MGKHISNTYCIHFTFDGILQRNGRHSYRRRQYILLWPASMKNLFALHTLIHAEVSVKTKIRRYQ